MIYESRELQPMCSIVRESEINDYISTSWTILLPVESAFGKYRKRGENLHYQKLSGQK